MGKYMEKKELKIRDKQSDEHIFRVKANIHGRRHTEYYSIKSDELDVAISLNLFKSDTEGYIKYFDWKPTNTNNLVGGIKKVNTSCEDDKYFYVSTDDKNVYSLPKYLRKDLPREDYILFGKREK